MMGSSVAVARICRRERPSSLMLSFAKMLYREELFTVAVHSQLSFESYRADIFQGKPEGGGEWVWQFDRRYRLMRKL